MQKSSTAKSKYSVPAGCLQVILPALCAAVCDADAGATIKGCGTVLGAFCSLPLLLDLLEPRLQDWADVPQRQAGGLLLLAAVLE